MSDRIARRAARAIWVATGLIVVAALGLAVANRSVEPITPIFLVASGLSLVYVTLGTRIAGRRHGNAVGWLLTNVGAGIAIGGALQGYVVFGSLTHPGSLPGTTVAAWVGDWILIPTIGPIMLLFLVFPEGRLPGPRWRMSFWALLGGLVIAGFGYMIDEPTLKGLRDVGVSIANPTYMQAIHSVAPAITTVGTAIVLAASLSTVIALRHRYRRTGSEERQQIRWLALVGVIGASLFVLTFGGGFVLSAVIGSAADESFPIFNVMLALTAIVVGLGIPTACAIAIFKYRLYDLDVVVKKTVVFGVIAVFITLVYAVLVAGVGALVSNDAGIAFVAAAVVAVAFQPVRERARRFADRLVYGKRATPYEVLAAFSDRMAEASSIERALPEMVESLAAATGAKEAVVWVRVGEELRGAASWPMDGAGPAVLPMPGDELPVFPEGQEAVEVRHEGEVLGAISVRFAPTDPMNPTKARLISDLAGQAGLLVRNVLLVEELRASRRRLVAAQDQARRRLERNIHDGAQQQLVALSVKLRLADQLARRDRAASGAMLGGLRSEVQSAVAELDELALGIYPRLLADGGLVGALQAQAARSPVPVTVEGDRTGRLAEELEAAVYFSCLEALQNMTKYANATAAVVRLRTSDGAFIFEVADDGRGFDASIASHGTGLQGLSDRLAAVGGVLEVRSAPGRGTVVVGRVPLGRTRERLPDSKTIVVAGRA